MLLASPPAADQAEQLPAPGEEWQTLPPPPAPPAFTQEEAQLMLRYIGVLEQAVSKLETERDAARSRFLECQGRGRT